MSKKKSYPFATVGGLVIANDGDILLVRSHKWKGVFSLPGGKIEKGETREEAFRREVKEETNLHIDKIMPAIIQESIFSSEFHAQEHFIMHDFIAYLSVHSNKSSVHLNEEAYEFLWVQPKEALKLILQKECRYLIEWYLKNQGSNYGTIGFEDYRVDCIIGINPEERIKIQSLVIDASFQLDLSKCIQSKSITETVNYTLLAEIASELAINNRYELIESLAHAILWTCINRFSFISGKVKIRKPSAIPSACAFVVVESSSK